MTFDAWKQEYAIEIDWVSGFVRRLLKMAYDAGFQEGVSHKKGYMKEEKSQEEEA